MLRRIAAQTQERLRTVAVAQVAGRRFLSQRCCLRLVGTAAVVAQAPFRLALALPRRSATTTATGAGATTEDAPRTDAEIVSQADWKSENLEARLGFRSGEAISEEKLKRHYYVLAKHLHPDSASGGGDGKTEAFQKVKEAYDIISASLKKGRGWSSGMGGGGADGTSSSDFAGGFNYSDEARRRSQMRILGETMMLFIIMTVLLIYIVGRHNKSRMQSRYLWHLVWIFVMIQLFPRLLAAAIIFAAHSSYLMDNTTLREQAAVSLVVERGLKECTVTLEGIRTLVQPHVVVQVTTSTSAAAPSAGSGKEAAQISSTLTFDKGVTQFMLPIPVRPHSVYHIRAVDEERRMVLLDRTLTVSR